MEVTKILIKDKWIMAMWYLYTVELYSAIKKRSHDIWREMDTMRKDCDR